MTWRHTKAGNPIDRPSSERGFHVEGPLQASDWALILEDIIDEMIDQAKREAKEEK